MIALPGSALRVSAITLMGSGVGSLASAVLLQGIRRIFEAVHPAGLRVLTKVVPFSNVEEEWDNAIGKPRPVFTL
jgi:hypothetical protein